MNEKMMILNMLQDGKITAEEASKLLATVEDAGGHDAGRQAEGRPIPNNGSAVRSGHSSATRPGSGVDFDELGRKFAAFAKDLEPKLQKVADTVAEKTVYVADKLAKSLETTGAPSAPSASGHSGDGIEKHIELMVDDGYNELNLTGLNGIVHIKGYNGDKISARIRYKTNRRNPSIELMKLGGKYYLNYEEDDYQFVTIDAYVPSHKFKVINIKGINGPMDLSALNCDQLEISNSNGSTALSDLSAESIKCESGNGHLTMKDINANTAVVEHFNGSVEAGDIDIEKLSLINFNGPMSMYMSAFARFSEYLWNIETSNAKLTLNVPTLPDLGYHIRAHATLGNIRIGLTGLEFLVNDPGLVEAQSAGFTGRIKKVRLAMETSNAALTVN